MSDNASRTPLFQITALGKVFPMFLYLLLGDNTLKAEC